MYIVIAGCGKVGAYLMAELCLEGHDVTIVDTKAERLLSASLHDVMTLQGNIIDPQTIEELDMESADLFIAVTASDEVNLLACLLAKKAGCSRTIARVRNPNYASAMDFLKQQLGLAMIINPEEIAARKIFQALRLPANVESETFAVNQTEIIKVRVKPDSGLANLPIWQVPSRVHRDVLICAVEREGKVFIPGGDFVLKERDLIYVAGSTTAQSQFLEKIGLKTGRIRSVMMIGAGRLSYYLAQVLAKSRIDMTIVEKDLEACETFTQLIPQATVINGDGSDQNVLLQEGLQDMDAFISLTGMDEENVFLSLYARKQKKMKTVTKINRIYFDEMLEDLDLDTVINPKKLTAETILQYVRSVSNTADTNVESVHKLSQDQAEALEFKIREGWKGCGIPLMQLPLKDGVLIALISRNSRPILPRGSDRILPGDTVIVITSQPGTCTMDDLLKKGRL